MRPTRPPIRATGPPRVDPERLLPDLPQDPDRLWTRLYIRGVDEDLEKLHGFRPGGYNPIHLQDELYDGQYRVIHKLGHGGYSTVWLCRDQHANPPSYVAVKILIASEAAKDNCGEAANMTREGQVVQQVDKALIGQHLCRPLKQFLSQSPNGTHICLVYPVLGPSVRDAVYIFDGELSAIKTLQDISRQSVSGLAALHSSGICHGDFRPSNILLELQGLNGLDEEQVLELLGEPEITDVNMHKDSHSTPEMPYAPKYLVYPVDFGEIDRSIISPRAQVIDFGQSFNISQGPLPSAFGIPANYAAPEVIIDISGSVAMDLWSLGCSLFEIRLGRRLFDVFQLVTLTKKNFVDEIASLLGKPPNPWDQYYTEPDSELNTITSPSSLSAGDEGYPFIEPQVERARSIQEKLASCHDCTGEECAHPRFQLISEAEATTLADLLERLLRYAPHERLSAQDVLKHAWFHTSG